MRGEYIPLDDPRVRFDSSRLGRVYTLDGPESTPQHPYPHTIHRSGLHQEPRMTSVFAPIKTWNLNAGDWCEIEVENVPLLGIAIELAEHHWDCDLFVDGEKIYGEFQCISTYMPSSDGFGYVHWIMLDRGKHRVRLIVSEKRNRMLDACQIEANHACINGFVLMRDLTFPPPVYNSWMFTQDELPGDPRNAKGSLRQTSILAGGYLYLMDLYGHGRLETLTFRLTSPLVLEVIDGGIAQPEFQRDFPSWLRRIDLAKELNGTIKTTVVDVAEKNDGLFHTIQIKPISFGSRLIVRLHNPFEEAHKISDMYMEGTLRCM